MNVRSLAKPLAAVAALGLGFGGLTMYFADTESTTSVSPELATPGIESNLIAGRIQSKFHPLPWIGEGIDGTTCPTALAAKVGTTMTCTAMAGTTPIAIPVRVISATSTSVTWSFER